MAVIIDGGDNRGSTLTDYSRVWVLDFGGNGDFASVEELQASSASNGDNVWVFGQSYTSATSLSKWFNWYMSPGSVLTLPTTISSAGIQSFTGYGLVYAGVSMTCSGSIYLYGTKFSIQNMTVSGSFVAHNSALYNGSTSSTRTMTVGTLGLYGCESFSGVFGGVYKFLVNGSAQCEVYNSSILLFEHSGSGVLYMDNFSTPSTVTKSSAGTVYMRNGRVNSLTFSTNGVNITLANMSVNSTLTLPATVGTTKFRHVNATTLTAPSSVAINSRLGIYDTVSNVTFADANVNVVAGSFA